MIQAVREFFVNIWSNIVAAVSAVWDWIIEAFSNVFSAMLDALFSALPELSGLYQYIDVFAPYFKLANKFIALDIAFWLFGCYAVFVIGFIIVKLIVKLIPSVG